MIRNRAKNFAENALPINLGTKILFPKQACGDDVFRFLISMTSLSRFLSLSACTLRGKTPMVNEEKIFGFART